MPTLLVLLIIIVVLAIIGVAVLEIALNLLWWALIGLVIGALARLVLPGRQPIGALATAASGVAGALLGGVTATAVEVGGVIQFIIAVLLAAAVVAAFDWVQNRQPRRT